ncbi:CKLF-like MARVEL transmembrane domain-containing protein 2 isoform X1 [Mesocricetus auratus]|uniref:CKLF-like MARVEL transmembrane domain-containing protein 2 isoform X1 n=1 Tax=Mesocricetus auratus TaxID=10036 RepID=A0ABM2X5C5_MESAU|nr:CKLF-like MARVEL transmembrane domain-containing protein 2 isoform X1 [Mesocricetus auratus]
MKPASTRHDSRAGSRRESSRSPSRATSQSQLGDPRSRTASLASISSVASHKGLPPSATPSTRSLQSVYKEQSASKAPPKKPAQSHKAPQPLHVSQKIKVHASVKRRADGRAKVPERFRDSFKHFFRSPTGMLKVLRMSIIAASVSCFIIGGAHEVFIAITIEETCIALFFIVIYLVTLQHMLICVHWPLLDLINSFFSTVFLGGVALITIQEREKNRLCFIGGTLCATAAVLCIIDMLLVIKKMVTDKKKGQEM